MRLFESPFLAMALNNAWANATLFGACAGLSEADFAAKRPGYFPSLRQTLNHNHEVDLFYIDALEGRSRGSVPYEREIMSVPTELASAQAATDLRLAKFCSGLSAETLAEPRKIERPGGVCEERVDAILLHLFQHQIHHRGQAHVQLQDAGIDPPQLDEFFLEFERAPTAAAYFQ